MTEDAFSGNRSEHSTWSERFTKRVTDIRTSYENTIRRVKNSMEVKVVKGTYMGKQFGLFKVSWEIGKVLLSRMSTDVDDEFD